VVRPRPITAFSGNVVAYYEKVREEDLLCTHTLIPPQANRAVAASQQAGGALMAHVVREDDNGIVVRGARMLATIGPFADELLVFPSTVLRGTPEDKPYSFAFAVPVDAPGLKFIAREPFDYGRSHFDHPPGLPGRRVGRGGDLRRRARPLRALPSRSATPRACNGFYTATDALQHMTHPGRHPHHGQDRVRTRPDGRLLVESIGIGQFQHVQADLAEIITTLETLRALGRAAEVRRGGQSATASSPPAWPPLKTRPSNLYPKLYQRFPEILRKLGASGLMATPTEADLAARAAADIDTYMQAATLSGRRAGHAVPPDLGHLRVRVRRQPPCPVRVLLLRRPGQDRDGVRGELRQVPVRGPRPRPSWPPASSPRRRAAAASSLKHQAKVIE